MYSDIAFELRRIRITLIVLGCLLMFITGASHNVTVDNRNDEFSGNITSYHKNLVSLSNGHFGLYSGDAQFVEGTQMKIYFYDENLF
ncbi:DUF6672 family protein [Fictibacillus barbaricus]|uniref:Uncharacterized protein n=1 Tax=Fictibacillus barbaricus TaxID=182136 RepID=A0ABS2Z9E3_9BACL|nr:DUF6672 family protein [Fictibacillus barbaricus]MBN3544792.1 hypothetical protein [Fictibacillus barbaricus]GGB64009.1 hypothetical protein GCM10007199_32600 [Fictibacillus barbaricus]